MTAGLSRTGEARNRGASEVSSVAASIARGIAGQVEVFGSWHVATWVDDTRGRGDLLAGAKVALLSQRTGAPFGLAVRGVLKVPTGNERVGTSTGRMDLLTELVASHRLGRAEVMGSSGVVRRGEAAGVRRSGGLRSGVGLAVLAAPSLRLFGELHGEVYFDDPGDQPLISAFDTPRTVAAGASWSWAPGFSATAAISRPAGTPREGAGFGVALRLGYQPGRRRPIPVAVAPPGLPPAVPPSPPLVNGNGVSDVSASAGAGQNLSLEDVLFDYDRFTLQPAALTVLDRAISVLSSNPLLRLRVEGHACEIGTPEYNLALGEHRARVVRDYLISRGVEAGRLEMVSFGEEQPKHHNRFEETRALNRRAELQVSAR
jgi:peptidoglycan-associated lipoprotein